MSKILSQISSLSGRTVLITGAAGHLAKTIIPCLADLGASFVLVDHPSTDLASLQSYISKHWTSKVRVFHCDLLLESDRSSLIQSLQKTTASLSCLINNAAYIGDTKISGWSVPFELQTIDAWRNALEVNLTAPFHLARDLSSILKLGQGPNIINIASIYGFLGPDWSLYKDTPMANPAAYSASKGGLIQLTKWLATTLSPHIRVNSISPGGIFRQQPDSFVDRYSTRTPLGRMAQLDDFVGAVTYLATDQSRYVTGHNLVIDGGWSIW